MAGVKDPAVSDPSGGLRFFNGGFSIHAHMTREQAYTDYPFGCIGTRGRRICPQNPPIPHGGVYANGAIERLPGGALISPARYPGPPNCSATCIWGRL